MRKFSFGLLLLVLAFTVNAKKLQHEKWYQFQQCDKLGGKAEFHPAKDRWVRIDCELPNYSIEVDFASKHYEAVGQALYYGGLTGKRPGIWLIVENTKDMRHAVRLARSLRLNKLPITVWLQRYRANAAPTFELYYKPSGLSDKTKLLNLIKLAESYK